MAVACGRTVPLNISSSGSFVMQAPLLHVAATRQVLQVRFTVLREFYDNRLISVESCDIRLICLRFVATG